MQRTSFNNKGFGAIGVLAIIVALVAVGGAGAYVWHHNHKAKASTTSSSSSTQTGGNNSTQGSGSTGAQQSYLTIKEWGVRIPMPSSVAMSDIYYIMGADSQNSSSPEAGLASHKLSALTADCVPHKGVSESPFGWIERMTPTAYQQALADSQNTGVKDGTLLGSYYYVWQVPRANCYSKENGNSQFVASLNQLTNNGTQLVDNFPANMDAVLKSVQVISQ